MHVIKSKPVNKDEAAKLLGYKTYDTAVPQPWLDELYEILQPISASFPAAWKDIILSSIVWCYDDPYNFIGAPVVLTKVAYDMLNQAAIKDMWDVTKQSARFSTGSGVLETRHPYIITGVQTIRDSFLAQDAEQARMLFYQKYPGLGSKITECSADRLWLL